MLDNGSVSSLVAHTEIGLALGLLYCLFLMNFSANQVSNYYLLTEFAFRTVRY